MKYDVIIIGSGPAGSEAAQILASRGKKIAIIEAGKFGGTCLNAGCIPTKMLLAACGPIEDLANLKRQKELAGEISINYEGLQKRVWRFVSATSAAAAKNVADLGVDVIYGRAKLKNANTIIVESQDGSHREYCADWLILATGSKNAAFPGLQPDHECVLDSTDILHLPEIPKSLCIVGAGAIGLEFASFFHAAGSKIRLVEAASHIAPTEDADIAQQLEKTLLKRGYAIYSGIKAKKLASEGGAAFLHLENGEIIESEKALVAIGRTGTAADLNLAATECKVNTRGFIEVDSFLMAAKNIFAVGDCNGKVLLAHAGAHQAAYAARKILGTENGPYEPGPVPACIYGSPQIFRVGLAEHQLDGRENIEVSFWELARNPIAQAHADPQGFVKVVWENGRIAGISAIGGAVTQLVTAAELLLAGNYSGSRLNQIMIAHPTLDESLAEAIRGRRRKI